MTAASDLERIDALVNNYAGNDDFDAWQRVKAAARPQGDETLAVRALRLFDAYDVLPADRGGENGKKGLARKAWLSAKEAALRAPVATPEPLPDDWDLEVDVFNAYNTPWTPEHTNTLRRLWEAYCAMEQRVLALGRGASTPIMQRVADRTALPNALKPGHPDAYLNALLDYTAGFYDAAREAGMPASAVADAMNHVERAARGLHAIALRGDQPSERELNLLDAIMCGGAIVNNAVALADKESNIPLLEDALNRAAAILEEGLNGTVTEPRPDALKGIGGAEVVEAYKQFPDLTTDSYDPGAGVPKHPLGKIVKDRGAERFAFLCGVRWAERGVERVLQSPTKHREVK